MLREQEKYKRMTNIKSKNLKKDVISSILHVDKSLLQKQYMDYKNLSNDQVK